MKRLAIALIVLMTISIQAQEKGSRKEPRADKQKSFMQDLTPEEAATLKTKKMILELDLTASQQSQIMKMNLEEAKERKTKRAEREKGKEKVKLSKEDRLAMVNNRLDKQIEIKNIMKEILNEEQFGKWEKSQKQKGRKMKKRGERKKGERYERMKKMN